MTKLTTVQPSFAVCYFKERKKCEQIRLLWKTAEKEHYSIKMMKVSFLRLS